MGHLHFFHWAHKYIDGGHAIILTLSQGYLVMREGNQKKGAEEVETYRKRCVAPT